jgi:hypothetical protein
MATKVTIVKQPLYGSVIWNGIDFVYTPNDQFVGRDFYVYNMTDGVTSITDTKYINIDNNPPVASNISLTSFANDTLTININDYVTDSDALIYPFKLTSVSKPIHGNAYIQDNNIIYESNGLNGFENFRYTVTDGQHSTSGNVEIRIIGGADTVLPDFILSGIERLNNDLNLVSANSADWESSYAVLYANSGVWNSVDYDALNQSINIVETNSASWNNVVSAKVIYDDAFTVLSSNSASWNDSIDKILTLTNIFSTNSAQWDSIDTIIETNSASWQENVSNVTALSADFVVSRIPWDDVTYIVQYLSSSWDKTELTNFLIANSANWDNTYNLVNSSSAQWEFSYDKSVELDSFLINNSENWESTYLTVSSNSAFWDKRYIENLISANSADWNSSYSVVCSNSANWDSGYNTITGISVNYTSNSANWDNTYNVLTSNSANWIETYNSVNANSANWDESYTAVNANSSTWNSVSAVYEKYDVAYTTLTSTSSNWDSSYSVVNTNSANWNDSYSVVSSNSSRWLTGGPDIDFHANNLTISGNAVIAGSISAVGGINETTTSVVSTSSFNIINIGTSNAIEVTKTELTGAIADFRYGSSSVLYISPSSRVGINTNSPNEALTVVGNISATGIVYGQVPPEYTVFQNNSAKYEQSNTYLTSLCGMISSKPAYDSAYSYVSGVSASLNTFISYSTKYDDAYNIVLSQSANNNACYNILSSSSANIGVDTIYRSNSANYTTAYNYVTSNSAAWVTNNPIFNTLSATTLSAGQIYLTNAILTTFNTPVTASESFLSISINGENRLLQLWSAT